ncbi:MAG: DUF4303 domain-containing protein [Myxococcales bacterium]|nr:DUF4303 domain-containing protein [Myxococcales bacterium]
MPHRGGCHTSGGSSAEVANTSCRRSLVPACPALRDSSPAGAHRAWPPPHGTRPRTGRPSDRPASTCPRVASSARQDSAERHTRPSVNTAQHLAAMQRQHPDEAMHYKFATPEWKYEATGADAAFRAICLKVRTQALAFEGVSKANAKTLGPERRRAHLAGAR